MANITASENFPIEKLRIKHFLSLNDVELEIKPFMIFTGDVASGKSLLIKLLDFFETIFPDLLFVLPYQNFSERLEISNNKFYNDMVEAFDKRFHLSSAEPFEIDYKCVFNEVMLDIKIFREKNFKNISVKSEFIESELTEWKKYLNELNDEQSEKMNIQKKVNMQKEAKLALYEKLSGKFGGYYPVSTTFVPATRAALAVSKRNSSNTSEYYDYYLSEFDNLVEFLKGISSSEYENEINGILNATMKINGDIHFISKDSRDVIIANASSGQQETAYTLLLLSRLFDFCYGYEEQHYIFIEEPEAHLFPREQKLVMEFICKLFEYSYKYKESLPIKFFITTHSPYVLNTINNMLLKGNIIKKFPDNGDDILEDEKTKGIPSLDYEKVSAVFINDNGNVDNILEDDGDHIMNPDKIIDISKSIMNDYSFLRELNNKFESRLI